MAVIKISQDGKDVRDNINTELVFSSEFNTYKVARVLTIEVPYLGSSPIQLTTSHGLGYPPAFHAIAFGDFNTDVVAVPLNAGWSNIYVEVTVDQNNVYCYWDSSSDPPDDTLFTFKVVLFAIDLSS